MMSESQFALIVLAVWKTYHIPVRERRSIWVCSTCYWRYWVRHRSFIPPRCQSPRYVPRTDYRLFKTKPKGSYFLL